MSAAVDCYVPTAWDTTVAEEHSGHDVRTDATRSDQALDERQLDHTSPSGRERDGGQQPSEREDGKHLGPSDVVGRHSHDAKADQEHEVERGVAQHRGQRQRHPPVPYQLDDQAAELDHGTVPTRHRTPPDQAVQC